MNIHINLVSIVVQIMFGVLIMTAIVILKAAFGFTYPVACLVGVPSAFLTGMLLVWLFGRIGGGKHN